MRRRQTRVPEPPHPDDEALRALLQDHAVDPTVAAHVAGCATCQARVATLRRLHQVVREAALREASPRRDLAAAALARLRVQRGLNAQVGEIIAVITAFLQHLQAFFAHMDAGSQTSGEAAGDATAPTPTPDDGAPDA